MGTCTVKLSQILLEENDRAHDYPNLYCRTQKPLVSSREDEGLALFPYERYDFSTYFNLFSNKKWREYTNVDRVFLHLEIKGNAEVCFVRYDATLGGPKRTTLDSVRVFSSNFESIDFEFKALDADYYGFEVVTYGLSCLHDGFFYTEVLTSAVRQVELAAVTTTFKQEEFITRNIALFKQEIIESEEPIADHFHLHVIDNGRTLDVDALTDHGITIHPNKNAGGAGGFTRGMIEALRQKPQATHVLLMDDDIQIAPESIKRTYALLLLAKDHYTKAFISGATIALEKQDDFSEDTGWIQKNGVYGRVKPRLNLSTLEDVVLNDTIETRKPNTYAGWWYCCIPVANIKEHGLPLPIFIRSDDAEYGNRAAEGFMTLNGICVWHVSLQNKYRAALECYQIPRNSLIGQATTGVYPDVDFVAELRQNMTRYLKTFNYDAAELALDGLEDFLKGPEFIMESSGEELLRHYSQKNETLTEIGAIDDPCMQTVIIDPHTLCDEGSCTAFERFLERASVNGHRLPDFALKEDTGVIPCNGWAYPTDKILLKKKLLAVSLDGCEAHIRTMDKDRYRDINRRYKKLLRRYQREREEVTQRYREAKPVMTSEKFWTRYLDIA